MMNFDDKNNLITKGKPSIFRLCFDKNNGGEEIAFTEFDVANMRMDLTMYHRLYLIQSPYNHTIEINSGRDWIDIGIKGILKEKANKGEVGSLNVFADKQ